MRFLGKERGMERYLDYILSRELKNGGWNLSESETAADCDITAMVLTALSNHCEEYRVKEAAERGLTCLSKMQNSDGGFSTYGEETAESVSQVISALAALGISESDARFVKNGKTPLDCLLTYYKEGGFSHTKGGDVNLMATEQAFIALSALKRLAEGKQGLFAKNKFCDILRDENKAEIVKMAEKGIINGMSENVFAPEKQVTRAEFATMAVRGLGIDRGGEISFADVDKDDWFYGYVASAYKNGIVYGVSETEFYPNGSITCEEAAAMTARAAAACGVLRKSSKNEVVGASEWAYEALNFCFDTEILDKNIPPKQILTRSQIAKLLYNMLKKAEKLD